MIFFEKLLKERFGDEKRQELWEKYTYRKLETADTSYLVEMIQDQLEKDGEDGKRGEQKNILQTMKQKQVL